MFPKYLITLHKLKVYNTNNGPRVIIYYISFFFIKSNYIFHTCSERYSIHTHSIEYKIHFSRRIPVL